MLNIPFLPTATVAISAILMAVSILSYLYIMNKDRKKDISELFNKKADKSFVDEQFKMHELMLKQNKELMDAEKMRLKDHNEKNDIQFKAVESQISRVSSSIDTLSSKIEDVRIEVSGKIDRLNDTIINLINISQRSGK